MQFFKSVRLIDNLNTRCVFAI